VNTSSEIIESGHGGNGTVRDSKVKAAGNARKEGHTGGGKAFSVMIKEGPLNQGREGTSPLQPLGIKPKPTPLVAKLKNRAESI